jgi:hypothetical protein
MTWKRGRVKRKSGIQDSSMEFMSDANAVTLKDLCFWRDLTIWKFESRLTTQVPSI